jgi:hypothetical protein
MTGPCRGNEIKAAGLEGLPFSFSPAQRASEIAGALGIPAA